MYNDVTGLLLSGGKSARMGVNKSLLKIGERTVIEIMVSLLKPVFSNIYLITNDPEEYSFLGIPAFTDIYPGKGPLAGIHSGLSHSVTERNFIISCDIPLMKREMINYLIDYPTDKPIVIARAGGFIQQLCGVYKKSCLLSAEEILKEDAANEERNSEQKKRGCRVLELVNRAGAEIIEAERLPFYDNDMYLNMNRKEEFEYVKQKLQ
ncbi:MAG: molybdenum cofactor guanylyltransferase [Bacillota bacterium]